MRTNVDIITKWLEVLELLSKPKTLKEIENEAGIAYKTVLKLVDDLSELGLIEKTIDDSTPPRYIIKRTKRGECLVNCFKD